MTIRSIIILCQAICCYMAVTSETTSIATVWFMFLLISTIVPAIMLLVNKL